MVDVGLMEQYLAMKGVFSIPEQQLQNESGSRGWDNVELGDLLHQMIDEEYRMTEKQKVEDYPTYLPLKI